ncbi:MAG: DEAD/DEAH box helicase [Phormidesmis sp.]
MTSAFARYPARLQEAIVARLGWTALRPVQELSSQALLDGKNAVILAPTAGGKTEAAMFPMLAQLMGNEPDGVGLLYIAPIKALLNNQAERLGLYTEMVGLRRFLWHGDVKASLKKAFVKEPATLLMTTPESLEVMLLSSRVPHTKLFSDLRAVVIDEVHALAGSDRGTHLISVLERIARATENDIQRVGLSATVGNPAAILHWMQGTSKRERCVVDPPQQPSPKGCDLFLM